MQLRIYARHLQYFNLQQQPVIYTGPNPASLQVSPGNVPQMQWLDITDDVANLDELQLSWSINYDVQGSESGSWEIQKSSSGSLLIEGDAYQFIRAWCIDHVAAPLNAVEIKVEDTSCGFYEGYSIKSSQITWCENEVCEFEVTLTQRDESLNCIRKTLIADNHQGWFQTQPQGGKKHPRFSYCNEARPNFWLIVTWWQLANLSTLFYIWSIVLFPVINVIIGVINIIVAIINAIDSVLGTGSANYVNWFTPGIITDFFERMYIETAGCGREHPAPLVRDYIKNVCDKCGVTVDAITAPIFFAQNISLEASTRTLTNVRNPHYNACYFSADAKRGIRRQIKASLFGNVQYNTTDFWIDDNKPLLTLDQLLNELKPIYNAEWRIAGGKLYFWRKDWFLDGAYLYDFTDGAADRAKILEGVCFEWNEAKYPAYVEGLYAEDAADTCGNEALSQMNGYASFGSIEQNPLFEGKLDKMTQKFGGTKFRLDGASEDYIMDAMKVVMIGQFIDPFVGLKMKAVDTAMNEFGNYALLMRDETCTLPKLLIWDGESYTNAKCIRNVVPINNSLAPNDPQPVINQRYNALKYNNGVPVYEGWPQRHTVESDVIGQTFAQQGVYTVTNYIGGIIANNAARLVNYPAYFEPGYLDTLWDWFHWIDDPRANPAINMNWRCKIALCCEDLERLRLLGDASNIALGQKVKLPTQFYHDGSIKEIEVSYSSEETVGKYIELKGTV